MGIAGAGVDTDALSILIADVKASGGSEIANTQPFIERLCRALGLDVGHVLEVYADVSGQGKNYAHFPDRRGYRINLLKRAESCHVD